MKSKDFLNDEWSQKYKKSINCASPKGFSQRAHCAGRKKNEGVAEGKKPDNYHIVDKDGKPASLASYANKDSAIKDRDEKYPDAKVHQVGPRGKVKAEFEEGWFSSEPASKDPWFLKKDGDVMRSPTGTPLKFKSKQEALQWAMKTFKVSFEKQRIIPTTNPDKNLMTPTGAVVSEGTGPVTHRIGLTVTDPNHPMVSKRDETYHKTVRVTGDDREKAINGAIAHARRKGYKVHDHHYLGTVDQGIAEATGDPKFDKMLKGITGKRQVAKQQKADTKQQARDAFGGMFGGGNPADKLSIRKKGVAEGFGSNRGYSHGFASPHAPSLGGRREREDDEGYGQEEQNNYAVVIDGRAWKVFADKQQAENIARSLRNKGKKASVSITGANPSESVTETDAESDDDVFSDRKRLPPKNLHALLQWAGNDPEKRYFRLVAEFGIKHELNLAATLGTLSDFDATTEADLEFIWGITNEDQAWQLFNAYENVYDAWVQNDFDHDNPIMDTWANESAEAELEEPPERPRKTTTKTKPDIKFDIPFQQDQDHPLAKTDPLDDLKKKAGLGDEPKVNIKKAKQKDTLSKTAGIGSDDMADMLGKLRNIEVDRDLEAYPEPEPPEQLPSVEVNTANLPAVAGQALQAAGVQNPEFHQVANLPGNMADQIRQLGKSLFGSLTMTPTKRIHVVANLGGQGPNSSAEVNAVAGFLKDHGRDLGPGDIDFDNVMPGYKAQTHMFSAAGIRWMLVKDFAGQYIYCWPEEDSHDAQDAIGQDQDVKKLK